jgi:hypothetical protein
MSRYDTEWLQGEAKPSCLFGTGFRDSAAINANATSVAIWPAF